jgi:hypothetical protein
MSHPGAVSRHVEVALHALDREIPDGDLRVLVVGVENGGAMEVWRSLGADVLGLDRDPRCAGLGLPVEVCDVTDEASVRGALRGREFDLVVDQTREASPWLWPFLRSGGRMLLEDLPEAAAADLASAVHADRETWLPQEEIMRVTVYPRVTVVEKRNPRVIPYLDIAVGNFADVVGEAELRERGVRFVVA